MISSIRGRSRVLTRSHLKEAFRAVAAIQKRVSGELSGAVR